VPAGIVSKRVTGFEDWLPTLFDLAGLPLAGRDSLDGISFAATLVGKEQPARPYLYREFVRQQAVWSGQWKAIRNHLGKTGDPHAVKTELYDLESDPTERHDVAEAHPTEVERLEKIMQDSHVPSKIFPIPALDGK
jgi:arylsulfatase A-like enzyme